MTDTDSVKDDQPPPPGRPVRLEPTPPGFRRLVLGALLAVLAPLFGLLVGSGMGTEDGANAMTPLYWGFFLGGLVGLPGLVAAGSGGMTMLRHAASTDTEDAS